MKNCKVELLLVLLLCLFFCFPLKGTELPRLSFNLYGQYNARGLETDLRIMKEALEKLGQSVVCLDFFDESAPRADINVFFEQIVPERLNDASLNWFIPNPEWCLAKSDMFDKLDLILCRTHYVEKIFKNTKKTYYMGFTSPDSCDLNVRKEFNSFLHLAGGSAQKGTGAVLKVWKKNKSLPRMFLITHYMGETIKVPKNVRLIHQRLNEKNLRYYQNRCGIHVCPSEAEGFGHILMESMSTGAVLVTTDAPPMNEFITDPRCLVSYNKTMPQWLGTNYYVDEQQLEYKIKALHALPQKEKEAIGRHNRLRYEQMREDFYFNLKKLLQETCSVE